MKKRFALLTAVLILLTGGLPASARRPVPGGPGAPHPAEHPTPPPAGHAAPPHPAGPVAPSMWGSPWDVPGGFNPEWQDDGYVTVTACGYDAQGVWRVLPLYVNYDYNGIQYDVTVINAYNPWTDSWDDDVDMPAYNTSYSLNGNMYDFYTSLTTGTYYFNL